MELLNSKKHLTFQEINNEWRESDLNTTHEALCSRTFRRWKSTILTTFHVEIEYNRRTGEYYIDYQLLTETLDWIIHTTKVQQMLSFHKNNQDYILLGKTPTGEKHLMAFIEAIRKKYQLLINYHPYYKEEAFGPKLIMPLCLKLYDYRWYAVVDFAEAIGEHRVIALDRITYLQQTEEKYRIPANFSAEEYFMYDYGIGVGLNEKPCEILLKVTASQRPYLRSLPLHSSQEEIETTDNYSVFKLFMKPSADLARAILQWGYHIEVLQPLSLRSIVKGIALAVLEKNK